MNHSIMKGFSFGLTSGIITTLGLIVGLNSGTHSLNAVIGGIVVIAIADAMSDALGVHISEESEEKHTPKEIWQATISTFFSKFIFSSFFIIPFVLFPLVRAIQVSVVIGVLLIIFFSYYISKQKNINPYPVIGEHVLIVIAVIFITYYVGNIVEKVLN